MTGKLAIIGASGKLGFATLHALLYHKLIPPEHIVCTTSSDGGKVKLDKARIQGVIIRSAHWDDESSFEQAFQGCNRLFLISSARVEKDFNEAPPGKGREEDHYLAIAAARKAGIQHIYYTSLAFENPSLSRVMKAHERTEEHLHEQGIKFTILREGLYNESWPLYLGHYEVGKRMTDVCIAGDSKISWTSIDDLGLANALILADPSEQWFGKTVYLSHGQALSLEEVAALVSRYSKLDVKVRIVSRFEHEQYHIEERGMDPAFIKWWSPTYDALARSECLIKDSTLEDLLATKGIKPKPMKETVAEMLK